MRVTHLPYVYRAAYCAELLRLEADVVSEDLEENIREMAKNIISQGSNLDFVPLGITDARRLLLKLGENGEDNSTENHLSECGTNQGAPEITIIRNYDAGWGAEKKKIIDGFLWQLGLMEMERENSLFGDLLDRIKKLFTF